MVTRWFPSPQLGVRFLVPLPKLICGPLAQLAERLTLNQDVAGSTPARSTNTFLCSADVWGHHGFYTAVMQGSIPWPSTNFNAPEAFIWMMSILVKSGMRFNSALGLQHRFRSIKAITLVWYTRNLSSILSGSTKHIDFVVCLYYIIKMAKIKKLPVDEIEILLTKDVGTNEIARLLNCDPATITYYKKKLGYKLHKNPVYDWDEIQKKYDEGLSMRDLVKELDVTQSAIESAIKRGDFKSRSGSDAMQLLSKLNKLGGCCSSDYLGSEQHRRSSAKGGGYKERAGGGIGSYVIDSFGNKVYLQSSYEIRCSEILDELKIRWIRPKYFEYTLEGKTKKYYPDFYLVDSDVYLDPKNDYLIKMHSDKIDAVRRDHNILLFIVTEENLNKDYFMLWSYSG